MAVRLSGARSEPAPPEAGRGWRSQVLEVRRPSSRVPGMYSRLARVYELWAWLTESKARRRVLELAAPRGDVLEVATGTGAQLVSLARANAGGRTAGVELSGGMLRETRRRLERARLGEVDLRQASALSLPFPDESFDLVVNGYMLDLLPRDDIPRALAEFRRVLRPGGRLVLSNMTRGERRAHRIWDRLYARGIVLTANCRGVLAAPVLEELGFADVRREYVAQMTFPTEIVTARKEPGCDGIREAVRERYAAAAKATSDACCGAGVSCGPADEQGVFGAALYSAEERGGAVDASLGCGNPTAVADLQEGESVLDLGSGAGGDALISARRVGPRGRVFGLDMTDEMLELARSYAIAAGVDNVEFLKGLIEDVPLPDASVDVVISNCVINLAADKRRALREAARVLRSGGRLAVSDVIAGEEMDEATRADMAQWTGCIAGALTRAEYEHALRAAGFEAIEVRVTHGVHAQAGSAIIRARKPGPA